MSQRFQALMESLDEMHPFSVTICDVEDGKAKVMCTASLTYRIGFFNKIKTYFNVETTSKSLSNTIYVSEEIADTIMYALRILATKDEDNTDGEKFDYNMSMRQFKTFLGGLELYWNKKGNN